LLGGEYGGKITRWDGAHDDYEGEHSVEWAKQQYLAGKFSAGGRQPESRVNGDWVKHVGRGRTLYVGRRENGKCIRIYEKGKQLGDRTSPWVRWEVELHSTDREIPWGVLLEPGNYLAGAYPVTRWISETASRIKTKSKSKQITEDVLFNAMRQSYGPFINYLMDVIGCEKTIIRELRREGKPKRLSDSTEMTLMKRIYGAGRKTHGK